MDKVVDWFVKQHDEDRLKAEFEPFLVLPENL